MSEQLLNVVFYFYMLSLFLVADTQLYKRLCPSVVRRLVGWSVGPWTRVKKWENKRFRTFLVADSCISAPAHQSATGGRVSGLVNLRNGSQTVSSI